MAKMERQVQTTLQSLTWAANSTLIEIARELKEQGAQNDLLGDAMEKQEQDHTTARVHWAKTQCELEQQLEERLLLIQEIRQHEVDQRVALARLHGEYDTLLKELEAQTEAYQKAELDLVATKDMLEAAQALSLQQEAEICRLKAALEAEIQV